MADPAKKKTDARISVKIELEIPQLPNFFQTTDGRSIPISQIPDATLRIIGQRWTDKLILHARKGKAIDAR